MKTSSISLAIAVVVCGSVALLAPPISVSDEKGTDDRLISRLNQALEKDPNDPNAYSVRGLAYSAKGGYDQAISDFTWPDPKNCTSIN